MWKFGGLDGRLLTSLALESCQEDGGRTWRSRQSRKCMRREAAVQGSRPSSAAWENETLVAPLHNTFADHHHTTPILRSAA